jgi:Fe-S-cluster containining protein
MKCLRCGYCCIHYNVIIVKPGYKRITRASLIYKPGGQHCPHLVFNKAIATCVIHDKPFYKRTPCFEFTQIEASPEDDCRIGAGIRDNRIKLNA